MIAILDYGIGNLRSAEKTLERVGAAPVLTRDADVVAAADGVVLPGVGNFGRVMQAIRDAGVDALAHAAVEADTPFLGICVGMQALYDSSDEVPGVPGLGILSGHIQRLPDGVKRPQMQWNQLSFRRDCALFDDVHEGAWVYFVHGYAPEMSDDVVATCSYGAEVVAAAQHGNVFATQFHPEKSGPTGLRIVGNFVEQCRPDRGEAR